MAGVALRPKPLHGGRFPQMLTRSNKTELGVSVRVRISRCEIKKNWRTRHDSNVWPSPSEGKRLGFQLRNSRHAGAKPPSRSRV
jgi:hypothetical protein